LKIGEHLTELQRV